jgi:hypothetical protein
VLEYIPCYGGPAEHLGLLPAKRLASSEILIEQNIKKRTGPALCVLCGVYTVAGWQSTVLGLEYVKRTVGGTCSRPHTCTYKEIFQWPIYIYGSWLADLFCRPDIR